MKTKFITFGAGEKCYNDAGKRLIEQAKSVDLFDEVKFFTDIDLRSDPYFWPKHGEFIQKNRRGYGYWLWKSYIIKKTMESMSDGEILLYLDCGCEIGAMHKTKLTEYFEHVKTDLLIGTWTQVEKYWNKQDLLLHLNITDAQHLNSPQRQGGAVLYYVCDRTREFVNMWYNTCCDYHMIDDTPSIAANPQYFREHRHDQSVFSLLVKKYNLVCSKSLGECASINRNKSGISRLT